MYISISLYWLAAFHEFHLFSISLRSGFRTFSLAIVITSLAPGTLGEAMDFTSKTILIGKCVVKIMINQRWNGVPHFHIKTIKNPPCRDYFGGSKAQKVNSSKVAASHCTCSVSRPQLPDNSKVRRHHLVRASYHSWILMVCPKSPK